MEFGVGSILEGKVTGITKFGAFVALPGNKSGLVHISEIAYSYVNDINEHLSEGQTVTVKVIGIDGNNRINLSIKQAAPPPPRPERRPGGPRGPRPEGGERGPRGDRPARGGGSRGPRPEVFDPKPQPKGPASFEDQLKQFMAASDSKLSELHMNEKRGNRRGGRK
jgi:S1 RNA binding domain protein